MKKITILIVDDSILVIDFVKKIFYDTDLNYNILEAKNGREACRIAIKKIPDLIIMDCDMPIMDGLTAMKKLKSQVLTYSIPIVMLTASDRLPEAFESGAIDYISKPFKPLELIHRVKSALTLMTSFEQIKNQKTTLERQHEQLIQHTEIVLDQRDQLAIQKQEITDSIRYAKLIQNAILPPINYLNDFIYDSFIFYLPKAIVSGDFYWVRKIENHILIAAADCTGHGVPGALMSIIGYNGLEQVLSETKETNPAEILNSLSYHINKALHNHNREQVIKDGMDIAMCSINLETKKLQYAGAYNPLYMIRENNFEQIKGDKYTVGTYTKKKEYRYKNHEIDLEIGDTIYIFTDGFADQFGGKDGKKFKYKRFRQLLFDIHKKEMKVQKQIVKETLENWQGEYEQVDDILLIGIHI